MKTIVIGNRKLTIEDVVAIAKKQVLVELDSSEEFQKKIDSGAEFLDEALAEHGRADVRRKAAPGGCVCRL